jgi:hypothetical protein
MDDPADQARRALLSGVNVQATAIGQLLQKFVAAKCSFCLFWASDYSDLPAPQSLHELLSLVSAQLHPVGSSNWEIYVHWQADA